jgi:hypothetical protein
MVALSLMYLTNTMRLPLIAQHSTISMMILPPQLLAKLFILVAFIHNCKSYSIMEDLRSTTLSKEQQCLDVDTPNSVYIIEHCHPRK